MKKLPKFAIEEIKTACVSLAKHEVNGCRNQRKEYSKLVLRFIEHSRYRDAKLPKNGFDLYFFKQLNLGTNRYPDFDCFNLESIRVRKNDTIRETEKSYIIESKYGENKYRNIVSKGKVVCFATI